MDDPIAVPQQSENIDWAADDESELPPINSLHAKFGTSGEVTPEVQPEPQEEKQSAAPRAQPQEADGFTPIPPRRGGGGERGFRGGDRGSRGRGGYRGDHL